VGISVLRSFQSLNGASWFHSLVPPTGVSIRQKCTEQNWEHRSRVLSNANGPDATIHEIVLNNTATTRPILLYFHGGGYHNALAKRAHVALAHEFASESGASSVFLLEYTLTPEAKYPAQLQQAVLAWQYLVDDRKIAPARIILGGDSAGAHLALSLIAHSMLPCPGIPKVTQLGTKEHRLKGLLLLSPWVTMKTDALSFPAFEHIDMITADRVQAFVDLYSPRSNEIWAELLSADESFWSSLPVESLLVTCGNAEALRDSILVLFDKLKAAESNGTRCELVLAEGEIHVHMALDYALGLGPCETRRGVLEWLKELS
jgi:acetyl esterase/lipase